MLKLGIISLVFFSLLLTAISLLLPSSINISRAINIDAPVLSVYNNINDMRNWNKWYADYDSSTASFSLNTIGSGAYFTNKNTTIVIESASPTQIKTNWKSGNSDNLPSQFNFIQQGESSQFTLQWQFVQKVRWYPWEKFASIISGKTIGPFMEKSLENLKELAETESIDNQKQAK
jgi:hypothetical protein